MTYSETVQWMFNQLPMYQQQGISAYREDLTNTLLLSDYLNHPERSLKCIHVAGTNGKGSTSHMLCSILMEAGYKVGLYTSPHLKDFRERIKINGQDIPEQFVTDFIAGHQSFFEANNLSFFEMSVGLAFIYFKEEKVDFAIIETGLGGRLDATNIITPILSVITNIGLDHVQILGNTLSAIAVEKAGIIKNHIPVVIGEYTSETKLVFEDTARQKQAPIHFASDGNWEELPSDLKGNYQIMNKKTVLQSVAVLNDSGANSISKENIQAGLQNVVRNTGLLGRWQQLGTSPTVICDTAHNKDGLTSVLKQVLESNYNRLHIVLGMVNDKDFDEILPLFPKEAKYYFCRPNIPRGFSAEQLASKAAVYNLMGKAYDSVSEAYRVAMANAGKDDFIFIGGSTFVVAEVL